MEKAEHVAAVATKSIEINTSNWFCYQDFCPSIFGSTAIFYDKEHLTAEYAALIGPEMLATFKSRKVI